MSTAEGRQISRKVWLTEPFLYIMLPCIPSPGSGTPLSLSLCSRRRASYRTIVAPARRSVGRPPGPARRTCVNRRRALSRAFREDPNGGVHAESFIGTAADLPVASVGTGQRHRRRACSSRLLWSEGRKGGKPAAPLSPPHSPATGSEKPRLTKRSPNNLLTGLCESALLFHS